MSYSEPKELIRARKLMEEAKFEEALKIVDKFGEKKDLSSGEQISYFTLKSTLAFHFFNKIECLEYAEKAYQASVKLGNSLQLLDVYIQMANGLNWNLKTNEADRFFVKSENLLKILPQELSTEFIKRKAFILFLKGYNCEQKGDLEKAKQFAEQALELREELDLKVGISRSLFQLSYFSRLDGDLNLALEYIESCKILADNLNDINLIQFCYMHFGVIYSMIGELDLALSYNEKVLAFAKEKNNRKAISDMLNNIGMIYQEKGDFDRALEYLEKKYSDKGRDLFKL